MIGRKVLVATSDSQSLEFFKRSLENVADLVFHQNGAAALSYIMKEVPSMVIVDANLPLIGGRELFSLLRDNPRTKFIPFLFIGGNEDNIEGFREGTDAMFTLPFESSELQSYIKEILFQLDDVSFRRTGDKEDALVLQIRSMRDRISRRVEDELVKEQEEAEKEGKYPWEGLWLTRQDIGKLEECVKRRNRVVLLEIILLFLVLGLFTYGFYWVFSKFILPS